MSPSKGVMTCFNDAEPVELVLTEETVSMLMMAYIKRGEKLTAYSLR